MHPLKTILTKSLARLPSVEYLRKSHDVRVPFIIYSFTSKVYEVSMTQSVSIRIIILSVQT